MMSTNLYGMAIIFLHYVDLLKLCNIIYLCVCCPAAQGNIQVNLRDLLVACTCHAIKNKIENIQ